MRINAVIRSRKTLHHRFDKSTFVEAGIIKPRRKSALAVLFSLRSYQADNRRRVDATRQTGAYGYIRAQADLYAIVQEVKQVLGVTAIFRIANFSGGINVPVAFYSQH